MRPPTRCAGFEDADAEIAFGEGAGGGEAGDAGARMRTSISLGTGFRFLGGCVWGVTGAVVAMPGIASAWHEGVCMGVGLNVYWR